MGAARRDERRSSSDVVVCDEDANPKLLPEVVWL